MLRRSTKSVAPLQKELAAIDKELATIKSQRKRFFKLFETSGVDADLFVERLSELKVQYEQLTRRKAEPSGNWRTALLTPFRSSRFYRP